MNKNIGLKLIALLFCFSLPYQVSAQTSQFEGLYYPKNSDVEWSCDKAFAGNDGAAYAVEGDMIYLIETSCQLTNPIPKADGTEFIGMCSAEGEEYRDIITLRKTNSGLIFKSESGTENWLMCEPSNWGSSHKMGVSETIVSNDQGQRVNFSCGEASIVRGASIFFPQEINYDGPVSIVIDGVGHNFEADNGSIRFPEDCTECLEKYGALMKSIFKGRRMTIVSSEGNSTLFGINGAKKAFYGEICLQADRLVSEDHVDCKFIADDELIHEGKCSVEYQDDVGITVLFAVGKDIYIPIAPNSDQSNASVYWNGPNGSPDARENLGIMQKAGPCWQNDKSAICYWE